MRGEEKTTIIGELTEREEIFLDEISPDADESGRPSWVVFF
jgi:hypothetical protein